MNARATALWLFRCGRRKKKSHENVSIFECQRRKKLLEMFCEVVASDNGRTARMLLTIMIVREIFQWLHFNQHHHEISFIRSIEMEKMHARN